MTIHPKLLKKIEQIEGWLSFDIILLLAKLSKQIPANSHALEVGSWKGKSASVIALHLREKQQLYCIDTFTGSKEHQHQFGKVDTLQAFRENIAKFNLTNKIKIYQGTSREAKINEPLGLIFIDGSHEYKDVKNDFKKWFALAIPGAYIAFHDYKWPGVKKVIWEEVFCLKNIGIIRRKEDTIYFKKLAANNHLFFMINFFRLQYYKGLQKIKRFKRKIRKKIAL